MNNASMNNVCNHCLFSIPSEVEMAEEQEYLSLSYHYWSLGFGRGSRVEGKMSRVRAIVEKGSKKYRYSKTGEALT